MKRFFRAVFVIIIVIIALMIAIPYIFKDDLMQKSQEVMNEQLNAKVEFADFRLSLFRHFPNLSVSIEDLSVSGKDQFAKDTLVTFQSFDVAVDLLSVIKKDIQIEGIYLKQPRLKAKVAADSAVNWDIMKAAPDEEKEEEIDTAAGTTDFRVDLKTFEISDGRIVYEDQVGDMLAELNGFNFRLNGDLGADSSYLDMDLSVDPVTIKMGAIRYLNQVSLNFKAGIGANIEEGRYHLLDNQFSLNELELNFDGQVEMADAGKILTNIDFHTSKTSFKSLLSLMPAIYMQDFADLQTAGNLSLSGKIAGFYQDSILPSVDINLLVEDAMFDYPDLPQKVSNIQVSLQTYFDGQNYDKSVVNLEKFHLELANNPFDASLRLTTPISDPEIRGEMIGKIALASLADAIPMEDTELRGMIESDFSMQGKMSMIETESYEQFKADGTIKLSEIYFSSPDLPVPFTLNHSELFFSPQYLELRSFQSKLGQSDINASGKIENYLSYALKDGTLKGDFSVRSSYFNANEFLTEDEEEETVDTTVTEMELLEVPERIDFKLSSRFDHIVYDQMDIRNAGGTILVKNRAIHLDDFGMKLFNGTMDADGEYNTQNIDNPFVSFDFAVSDLKVEYALRSFAMLDTLVPVLRNTTGDISLDLEFMSNLLPNMEPDLQTMNGYGQFQSDQLVLSGSKTLNSLLTTLKITKDDKHIINNLQVDFALKEGRIIFEPFDVSISNIPMTVSGSQGIDQTMDYMVDMQIPKGKFGEAADKAMNTLLSSATGKDLNVSTGNTLNVKAKITGTFDDPKIQPVFGKGEGEASAKEQIKDEVKKEIEDKKEEAKEKAREEAAKRADQIVSEAKERAEQIRAEARRSAAKIREEADKKAQKVIEEAEGKNFLVQKAAEESAKQIRKEADKRAEQLIEEADKKADRIVKEAEEKAEEIKNK